MVAGACFWTILPWFPDAGGSHLNNSPAMTVRDVAGYLNVDEKTVYRLAQRGELPGFKVAGTWRFKRGDLDVWIEQKKQRPEAKARRRS